MEGQVEVNSEVTRQAFNHVACIHARSLDLEKVKQNLNLKDHVKSCVSCQDKLRLLKNEQNLLDREILKHSVSFDSRRELEAEIRNLIKTFEVDQREKEMIQRRKQLLSFSKVNTLSFAKQILSPVNLFFLIVGVSFYLIA